MVCKVQSTENRVCVAYLWRVAVKLGIRSLQQLLMVLLLVTASLLLINKCQGRLLIESVLVNRCEAAQQILAQHGQSCKGDRKDDDAMVIV